MTDAYQKDLFRHVPIYSTRLVREGYHSFVDRAQVCKPDEVASLLIPYYAARDREELLVVFLDCSNTVTGLSVVSVGGLSASIVEPRAIFKAAILANAAAIILAHNHPSGSQAASREDVRVTRQVFEAGRVMGIPLRDHIIICEDEVVSLAQEGII